VRIV
jgi:hypothetical protein